MLRTLSTTLAALSLCLWIAGCGGGGASQPAKEGPAKTTAEDGHEGHDHAAGAAHMHPSEGPHGGHLIELDGGTYHAELVHDEASNTVTVHLLDAVGQKPVAIRQEGVTVQLLQDGKFVDHALKAAAGQQGGGASQFTLVDAKLTDALSHDEKLRGRLRVTIDGKPYSGVIEHTAHAHEGHQPGDDHKHDEAGHAHE